MEAFREDEYLSLLDDMVAANMNSLMIFVKWLTTGYRSRLSFQDQLPDNPVIASDNALLRKVIEEAGRPPFKVLGHPLNPRSFDVPAWRDYTTHSRLKVLKAVEDAVRARGFRGDLAMICETGRTSYTVGQAVNVKEFHKQFPNWIATTYEYDKWNHRYAMMAHHSGSREIGSEVDMRNVGISIYSSRVLHGNGVFIQKESLMKCLKLIVMSVFVALPVTGEHKRVKVLLSLLLKQKVLLLNPSRKMLLSRPWTAKC